MPNIVGQELETAQGTLQAAGVVSQSALGYFGTWPITVTWQDGAHAPGVVITQSPTSGMTVTVNQAIALTCQSYPMGCVYP